MATHKTAEESRKEYIANMGELLGTVFYALWQEMAWLHMKWGEYIALYGENPSRIDLLNKAAPQFFRIIQDSLWEDTLLHIARLTDPPKSAGKDNLSVQRLPSILADRGLKQKLDEKIEIAKRKSEFCRDWRNRRIAHRDLKLAIEEGIEPLKPASGKAVKEALASLVDVLNLVSSHYQDSITAFDLPRGPGDGEALLYVIDDGLKSSEERLARIKSGKWTESDLRRRHL